MALFKKEQFEKLASEEGRYCISIYIPTNRSGENKESMIRLKNKVADIEKKLARFGLKPKEVAEYTKPLKRLIEDNGFWRNLSDALLVFRSKKIFEYYILPLQVQEFTLISERFHLLPLINIFNKNNRFFILQLSLKKNKLFEATQHEITEIITDDILPENMYDSAGHDVEQKSLQMRGEQTGDERSTFPGKAGAIFHGKGEGKDDKEIEIRKYFEDIDAGLKEILHDYQAPLVVASDENIFSHFKEISTLKNLYPKCVAGNQDYSDNLLIHEKAKDLLIPYFNKIKDDKINDYSEAKGKTTSSLKDIIISADAGKIDTLFVARNKNVWGEYIRDKGIIQKHNEKEEMDNCLIDLAAKMAFLKGGNVFIEGQNNLPENTAPVNAILRY